MAKPRYVGVDIGGTKVLAVRLKENGELEATATLPMPGRTASADEVADQVARAALEVYGDRPPEAVGVSVAGLVNASGKRFLFGAHLPWRDYPVRKELERRLDGVHDAHPRVVVDNDANCAAYAEMVDGAAVGRQHVVVLTVGTGIGGALVLGGQLFRGATGVAGEFGHMQVVPDGLACECGLRGCWEQYCSGRALERITRVAIGRHITGPEVSELARSGDKVARQAFASVGTWLGVGVAALASALDPELFVVGGGVSAVGDLLLDPARTALAESLQGDGYRAVPRLVPASFGPGSGAVGAALMARDGR